MATASHSRSPWTFLDLADFHRARPAVLRVLPWHGQPPGGGGLGTYIVDLHRTFGDQIFAGPSLNAFMSRGPRAWQRTRERLLASVRGGQISELVPIADATLHLPFEVADFADFYSSLEHATNAARVLRPGDPQLHRNWREMPVGYHGRAGTVVVSGTPVRPPVRPAGPRARAARAGAHPPAGLRGGDRLRGGGRIAARPARPGRGVRRARVRRGAAHRLERAGHPGVRVPAAGPVPGQVLRDHDLAVGHPAGRAGAGPGAAPRPGPRSRSATCGPARPGAWISTSR